MYIHVAVPVPQPSYHPPPREGRGLAPDRFQFTEDPTYIIRNAMLTAQHLIKIKRTSMEFLRTSKEIM